MDLFQPSRIVVTHALYGGSVLKGELAALGYKTIREDRLHLEINGNIRDAIILNMHLRTAHRVLILLDHFHSKTLKDLYSGVKRIEWEDIIPVNGYFSIHAFVRQPGIKDFRIASLNTKDAIADRFMEKYKLRPDSGKLTDKLVLYIHWYDGLCHVYLDTSGESIARHGYRKHSTVAPLSEALAALIVLSTKWNKNSAFINPMCGSGTIAIEAAMIATGRYPGLYRMNYSFLHVKNAPVEEYQRIKKELTDKITRQPALKIIATDIERNAVQQARKNIEHAELQSVIELDISDFRNTPVPENNGIIVLNPPYGERMGEIEKLEGIYRAIGDFFKKNCQGYTGYVFTGNPGLGKKIGLRTSRKIPMMNGNIECRLLEYPLYAGSAG